MLYNKHNISVAKFAAKESTANNILKGVYFAKDKTVATDSFRLLEVSVDSTLKAEEFPMVEGASAMRGCSPFVVSAKQVLELKPKGVNRLPITQNVAIKHIDDKRVEFFMTDLESADIKQARRIDGQFPSFEQIFPKETAQVSFMVDGALFAELLKVMSELPRNGGVRVYYYGINKPIEVRADGGTQKSRALMILMKE